MAHLNVRDRLLEAKIAYVGPPLSGKATNFAQLRSEAREGRAGALVETPMGDGRLLAFDWRPGGAQRFDDCDVMVKLVTTHGAVPAKEVERVVADADGLVLVLDADPAAQSRNRDSIASLRAALVNAPNRPVVVQVNKSDLPDAVPPAELMEGIAGWPQITACAARGEGVVETLQQALRGVLDSIKRPTSPAKKAATAVAKPEANALLSALRQVMQATVTELVGELETRIMERFEARMATLESNAASRHAEVLDAIGRVTADEGERILAALTEHGRKSVAREDVARIETGMETLRSDLARRMEARAKQEKEHHVAAMAQVQRVADVLADDIKRSDARPAIAELARGVQGLPPVVEEARAALQRVIDFKTSHGFAETQEALATLNAALVETKLAVDAVLEEMKKPKKGWFG
jgi:signal recognition particle receptor subunit beta